ncbi:MULTISPECIES: hypothetical protein [Pseudofrankia]|uniref:hypothetical protein n=1 Tax=Pseudofrankia TaxID=2994363 RepID=UPI0012FF47B2|nr:MULTISPECIES: hypothetical protein [Pseudofrankia]
MAIMEDQDDSDVERYYGRLCSELDMIRSGPVLAGPRTIEHIRSLLALIDLHRPNEFDVCLGCDRLWPCASVLAVTGLPPELPAADQEAAAPRPLPGVTRRPRAAAGAATGAFATAGAQPAQLAQLAQPQSGAHLVAAAGTDQRFQPAARAAAQPPASQQLPRIADLPDGLRPAGRDSAGNRAGTPDPARAARGHPVVAPDGRLTPGMLPDPPAAPRPADATPPATVGRGVLIPTASRQAPPPASPPTTPPPPSSPPATAPPINARGGVPTPPPTGPMPHIPPPGESYPAFPPPETGGANPAFPPPGTTAASLSFPPGMTGAHPILPPPGMTGALPVFPPPAEGQFQQGHDGNTGAQARYQPPTAQRQPSADAPPARLQPPGQPTGGQRPQGQDRPSARPGAPGGPAEPGLPPGSTSSARDTRWEDRGEGRGYPAGASSFPRGGQLPPGVPPPPSTPPPGVGLPGLSAPPGAPGQPAVPGQSMPPSQSGPRPAAARSGYPGGGPAGPGAPGPARPNLGPPGQPGQGRGEPPASYYPPRPEQGRPEPGYGGYFTETQHRPAGPGGPGGPGGPVPPAQPGGGAGSFGPAGGGGLPGSIDPRLRPPAGPPRGQSRSISAPPPPHRSIHTDSVDPVTGRPNDPTARRLGPPVPDDVTPEWMSRRDPILDGIDVI